MLTTDDAAHLLRRMGFGGNAQEISDLASRGRDGAVDYLIDYNQIDNSDLQRRLDASFDFSEPDDFPKFNRNELQRMWFTRMTFSRRQFEEKMTLFWHNFFATSNTKVDDRLMHIQNLMLRKSALARFDDLLLKVAQDPAMMVWLDTISNVRESPNENFGRELQELFSMGIHDVVTGEPNYTEQDVKEIARAFTGWTISFPRGERDPFDFGFRLNQDEHDFGPKTVYGVTANFNGEDIIEIICARRATARFLVHKLFEFFVYPLSDSVADQATTEKFADVYLNRNHSIRELVRAIFRSDEFFSPRARFALIKQPVELVVGAVRMIGATYNQGTWEEERGSNILAFAATFLGQDIFNPPDVSGWDLNLGWINTAIMLNRFTFADLLAISRPENPSAPGLWLTHEQVKKFGKKNSKKTLKKLLSALGPLKIDAATNDALTAYLESDDEGNRVGFRATREEVDKKVRGAIHLIMCLAEFQVN